MYSFSERRKITSFALDVVDKLDLEIMPRAIAKLKLRLNFELAERFVAAVAETAEEISGKTFGTYQGDVYKIDVSVIRELFDLLLEYLPQFLEMFREWFS